MPIPPMGLAPEELKLLRHVPGQDDRITAFETLAKHPFFAECFAGEVPLVVAMKRVLDRQVGKRGRYDEASPAQVEQFRRWLQSPSGTQVLGLEHYVEAVRGGGLLIRHTIVSGL